MFSWKKVIWLQFPYNVFHSLNYAIIAAEDIENGINNLSLRRVWVGEDSFLWDEFRNTCAIFVYTNDDL
jgi:hypothetical protein